jgi:hypothetical protein
MRPVQQGQRTITPEELVSLTEGLADSYVGTIAGAVEAIQAEKPPPDVRTNAQRVKAFVAFTAYSLATRPNPQIALMELAANISVQRMIWDSGLAAEQLGDQAAPLQEAYQQIESQAWAIVGRIFTDQQVSVLRDGVRQWLAAHPQFKSLPFVDLPALAQYRDLSLLATPGGLSMLAPVAEGAKAAMELRLLGERSLYLAQRVPYLAAWQGERVLYDALDVPEAQQMLESNKTFASSAERLASVVEQLPNTEMLQMTMRELNTTLRESGPLVGQLHALVAALGETIEGTDRLLSPFETPARAIGGGPPERRFEVGQYTAALREVTQSAHELNELLVNTRALVASPDLSERLSQVQTVTDSGVGKLAEQSNRVIDRIFWRGVGLVATFFVGLVLYRAATLWMSRRFPPRPAR